MLPDIVDSQQTGFVSGRSIVENVRSLRLAQEWAQITEQKVIFVKLDFSKAYDRVSHTYLWETLQAIGLEDGNLQRIQGLVRSGSAAVHVNGQFTEEFQVQRGVRQGCLLAPLLFAVSTQPLMRLLREEEREKRLTGLNMGGERTLLHQLYADDTGINVTMEEIHFNRLQEVIHRFERCSWARLNMSKSLIMPLAPTVIPNWVQTTGCRVAGPGTNFLYFGISASCPVDEHAIAQSVVAKVEKKLAHWSNRLLSWPAKTLLLKHVLSATPLYELLSVGLASEGIEALERLCRHFLWGWSEQGNPKKALISWERIAQTKANGGLGWIPIKDRAKAFHVKIISQLLQGTEAEWAVLARRRIPTTLTLPQAALLMKGNTAGVTRSWGKCTALLRKGGIITVNEGLQTHHEGHSWAQSLRQRGIHPEEDEMVAIEELEAWILNVRVIENSKELLMGWRWTEDNKQVTWTESTKCWTSKFGKPGDFEELLNNRWGVISIETSWNWRWKHLWAAPVSYRPRVWLWKFLQRRFFMGKKALEIGIDDGICKRCRDTVESLEHCFWFCMKGRQRREDLRDLGILLDSRQGILDNVDRALRLASSNPAFLVGLRLFIDSTWRERNDKVLRGRLSQYPTRNFLKELALEVESIPTLKTGKRQLTAIMEAKRTIERWRHTWRPSGTVETNLTAETDATEEMAARSRMVSLSTSSTVDLKLAATRTEATLCS
ncbi:hypothetical protein R1sor_020453 [Riccia sorocarpa]|uniref:Reverse transcriptase domain-containing protein n=1 Tax=Riccia sorocarpa TaxID=122646 RepID=A0ABD3IJP8_9MARC